MKVTILDNNKVTGIIVVDEIPDGYTEIPDYVCAGWVYDSILKIYKAPQQYIHIIDAQNAKLTAIKQIASQKINTILSDVKQRNSLYTLYKHNKRVKSSLTVEEKAEIADLENKWTQIEAIRTASNQIEAEVNNLQTLEEVQAYNIKDHKVWLT